MVFLLTIADDDLGEEGERILYGWECAGDSDSDVHIMLTTSTMMIKSDDKQDDGGNEDLML